MEVEDKIQTLTDVSEFQTDREFFDWYSETIRQYIPRYDVYVAMGKGGGGFKRIHRELPRLTKSQVRQLNTKIRETINFSREIVLKYTPKMFTWYCTWDSKIKKLVIGYPTCSYFWIRNPKLLLTAMQHELGHILNGDLDVQYKGHSGCSNSCKDIRINANLDYENLRQINNCLFHFKIKENQKLLVPEDTYHLMNLDIRFPYTWEEIHNNYHTYGDDIDLDEEDENQELEAPASILDIGNIVIVNSGSDAGKVGAITEVVANKDKWEKAMEKPSIVANDPSFLNGVLYEVQSVPKEVEDLYTKKIKLSQLDSYQSIGSGGFVQSKIGDFETYQLTQLDYIDDMQPPPPPPPPNQPPPPQPPPRSPQVGDVVEIQKGKNKGKFGVIKSISVEEIADGEEKRKYDIEQVSIEVVNSILGTKATK
jgi:hypothetical protein